MKREQLVSLETIARGAVAEQFDYELTKVLGNIVDPNTNPCEARTITIKVVFKPDMRRESAAIKASASSSLAANIPVTTTLFIEERGNSVIATEMSGYDQAELPLK
ncbi:MULTISPECIES: hypothetical protein [Leptolyngbya]|nr:MULTISPECIES: hypothetical protein [Leptolyngbya]MBD2370763.1 hypothetical protein [Leptolyngbya sp. FACHB-161]MBD2377084.1 hypothetical protein [Leptolyngbya sp. FACHB-238]MBD2401527.1 hypothetical protein [Leptolyngbya sp. FACHB-239]MBD2408079.1 hypothetical protein [Leptolyngbya sp. FACHB-402]ULP29627.1 hypothetical protein MCP04_26960 [Leptolyngbya boryana IU 594]